MYSRIGPSNPWVQVTSPGWLEACQSERCPHDWIHLSRSIELRFRFKSDTSVKLRVFQACQFVILPAACSCFFSTVDVTVAKDLKMRSSGAAGNIKFFTPWWGDSGGQLPQKPRWIMISCRHLWKKWTFNVHGCIHKYQDDKMDWISRLS